MYCPNCGAENKKKQNYCRYCGLSLRDIEKSYLSQLVFGEDTKQTKNFRNISRLVDYTQILLIVFVVVGSVSLIFYNSAIVINLLTKSVGIFFLIELTRQAIGYFQRRSFRKNNKPNNSNDSRQSEVEARETTKLIEEKEFVPASSVTENSTRRLYVERKLNDRE